MSTHVEIEAKYDVARGQEIPDLIGVGGVRSSVAQSELVLTAVYYDTGSHALGSARATLRRRTGGTDDGWHLKLPLARGERLELHRPLGRGRSVPAPLASVVRGVVRSEPLEPVATLVTRRTVHHLLDGKGRLLAELADDSVTGERHDVEADPLVWRELEVELVECDREVLAALDAAVRAAGVLPAAGASKVGRVLGDPGGTPAAAAFRRKSPVGEVLEAALRAAVRDVVSADPLVRIGRPDGPTRMRDAVQRLLALLALERQVEPVAVPVRPDLVWLCGVLGEVAGLDAARDRVRAALSGEPRELVLGPVGRRVDRELAAARREAVARQKAALDSGRYLELLAGLAELPGRPRDAGAATRAGDVLPALAERALRRTVRRLSRVRTASTGESRALAVDSAERALQRGRSAADLVTLASRAPADSLLAETLDGTEATLAELQLSRLTQQLLRDLGVQAQLAGENGFTFGRLHGLEDLAADRLVDRLGALRRRLKRLRTT